MLYENVFVKVSMNAEADPAYIHSRVRVYVFSLMGNLLLYVHILMLCFYQKITSET